MIGIGKTKARTRTSLHCGERDPYFFSVFFFFLFWFRFNHVNFYSSPPSRLEPAKRVYFITFFLQPAPGPSRRCRAHLCHPFSSIASNSQTLSSASPRYTHTIHMLVRSSSRIEASFPSLLALLPSLLRTCTSTYH